MIDFSTAERVVAVWFASGQAYEDGELRDGDIMGCLYLDKETQKLLLTYRLRVYGDDRVFDSGDEKRWKTMVANADVSEDTAFSDAQRAFVGFAAAFHGDLDTVEVRGTPEQALELMMQRPWCHVRKEALN